MATGALERPLVFANNDVPGCMLASAVSTYINRYAVASGSKLVLMTTNDYAYQTAIDWHNAGREVVAIVDTQQESNGDLVSKAHGLDIKILSGKAVIEVSGSKRVTGVKVAALNSDGSEVIGKATQLTCDTVASSGGWSLLFTYPATRGASYLEPRYSRLCSGPASQNQLFVGGAVGTYSLGAVLEQGAGAESSVVRSWADANRGQLHYP